MIYLGLPSTLTPERIKDVLGLAKSHERALRSALDANTSPAWTGAGPETLWRPSSKLEPGAVARMEDAPEPAAEPLRCWKEWRRPMTTAPVSHAGAVTWS